MSDEKNAQPENQTENELSENELNDVAGGAGPGGGPSITQPGTENILIGLLVPAVKVSVGDVNGDIAGLNGLKK